MMRLGKWLALASFAFGMLVVTQRAARADDDCLEIGWVDGSGNWSYYHAWVDDYNEHGRVHIKYDYHHGELEMKVSDVDTPDGDMIIFRGKWFEGKESQRGGRVLLKMEKGHHHARGFYTNDDSYDSQHYDLVLRDCKTRY